MKKLKVLIKSVLLLVSAAFAFTPSLSTQVGTAFASGSGHISPQEADVAQKIVYQVVDSINNKDWSTYADLQPNEYKDDLKTFLLDPKNQVEGNGILTIESAKIHEIKLLPESALNKIVDMSSFTEHYGDTYAFLVGSEYKVKKESKYYLNGVNYDLFIIGKEDDKWKVLFKQDAPVEVFSFRGYGFNSKEEQAQINVMKERYKGNIVNHENKLIERNAVVSPNPAPETVSSSSSNVTESAITPASFTLTEPSTIAVYHMYSSTDPYYHTITHPSFDFDYISDVLPVEIYDNWNINAQQAMAIAAKVYGWHYWLNPKSPAKDYGADVVDTVSDQRYQLNSHTSAPNLTTAASNEKNICARSSTDVIFDAQYRAGTQGSAGTQNGGVLSQWGSQYLATSLGYYTSDILKYYYSNSDKSPGEIKIFNVLFPS